MFPCIYGCNNPTAINYDPNVDSLLEGSCIDAVIGCLNFICQFNSEANIDDEPSLCSDLIIYGCTDSEAVNFNEFANTNQVSADNMRSMYCCYFWLYYCRYALL